MKKLVVLFMFLVSCPFVFGAPNWYEGANDNFEFYDDSEFQNYAKQLEDAFNKKYCKSLPPEKGELFKIECNAPMNAYNREVEIPLFEFRSKHPPKYKHNMNKKN